MHRNSHLVIDGINISQVNISIEIINGNCWDYSLTQFTDGFNDAKRCNYNANSNSFFTRKHFSLSFFFFFEITIKKRTSNKLNGIECLLLLNEILTQFIDQRKKIIGFWNEKNLTTFNSQHLSISLSCWMWEIEQQPFE